MINPYNILAGKPEGENRRIGDLSLEVRIDLKEIGCDCVDWN
jgi:hypothetical protein